MSSRLQVPLTKIALQAVGFFFSPRAQLAGIFFCKWPHFICIFKLSQQSWSLRNGSEKEAVIPPALELPAWSFQNWVSASLRVERYYFISVHALGSWWPHLAPSSLLRWLLLLNEIKYHPVFFFFFFNKTCSCLGWKETRSETEFSDSSYCCLLTRKEQKNGEENSRQTQIKKDEDGAVWGCLHTTPPFWLSVLVGISQGTLGEYRWCHPIGWDLNWKPYWSHRSFWDWDWVVRYWEGL